MASRASNPRDKLAHLLNRAASPTDELDEEARTAAVQACKLLTKHPELLAPRSAAGRLHVPQAKDGESTVHPEALRLREWRRMLRAKGLVEGKAKAENLCADCGQTIEQGSPVIASSRDELATHAGCGGFWWKYQPEPDDDDIPF